MLRLWKSFRSDQTTLLCATHTTVGLYALIACAERFAPSEHHQIPTLQRRAWVCSDIVWNDFCWNVIFALQWLYSNLNDSGYYKIDQSIDIRKSLASHCTRATVPGHIRSHLTWLVTITYQRWPKSSRFRDGHGSGRPAGRVGSKCLMGIITTNSMCILHFSWCLWYKL